MWQMKTAAAGGRSEGGPSEGAALPNGTRCAGRQKARDKAERERKRRELLRGDQPHIERGDVLNERHAIISEKATLGSLR